MKRQAPLENNKLLPQSDDYSSDQRACEITAANVVFTWIIFGSFIHINFMNFKHRILQS